MCDPLSNPFGEGADAADEVLGKLFHVEKAAMHPLDVLAFEALCRALARALAHHAAPVEHAVLQKAMRALDADWTDLSAAQRNTLLKQARSYLGEGASAGIQVGLNEILDDFGKPLLKATKADAIAQYGLHIAPTWTPMDTRIERYARLSQGHFIRERYGARAVAWSDKARDIVADSLAKGLGSNDIAEQLQASVGEQVARARSYWSIIATVFASRSRSMALLAAFDEGGIEEYVWQSVLDEVTSVQCRFLDGRRFSVKAAMATFQRVEDATDPMAIKTIQPFMNVGRDDDGNPMLYYRNAEGGRTSVARVLENAVGRKDERGQFSHEMASEALAQAGMSMPPIHGSCRSTVVYDGISKRQKSTKALETLAPSQVPETPELAWPTHGRLRRKPIKLADVAKLRPEDRKEVEVTLASGEVIRPWATNPALSS